MAKTQQKKNFAKVFNQTKTFAGTATFFIAALVILLVAKLVEQIRSVYLIIRFYACR